MAKNPKEGEMRVPKSILLCFTVLATLGLFSAVTFGQQTPKQYGGVLRLVETPPGSPFGVPWEIIGVSICSAIPALEPLLWMDRSGNVYPKLAEKWKVSPDKKSIFLSLRKEVKFHDGTDFNAEAVRFCLQKQLDSGLITTFSSVEVVDDHTVKIGMKEYDNRVFVSLAGTSCTIISPTALNKNGIEWARWHPVGTGPFEFVSYERGVGVKYKKFKDYWDKGKPYLDGVEIKFIADPQTIKAAFLAGEIDVFGENGGELVAEMKKMGMKTFSADNGIVMLWPDSMNADSPLSKKLVRQAISYAIDREGLAKARGFGTWKPSYQVAFPEQAAYLKDYRGTPYDPKKAKELLAQAGYGAGFKIKLIPMPAVVDRDAMVAVQRMLSEVGIEVELEFPEMSRYREYQVKGWRGMLAQPWGFFANFNSTIGFYFLGAERFASTKRPEGWEKLFDESRTSLSVDPKLAQRLQKLILDDMTVIPLYMHTRDYVARPNVHDTNHMKWVTWPWWTPAEAWLSK